MCEFSLPEGIDIAKFINLYIKNVLYTNITDIPSLENVNSRCDTLKEISEHKVG